MPRCVRAPPEQRPALVERVLRAWRLDQPVAQRVAAARDRDEKWQVEPLTPREIEVLRALTEGLSTPEICARLFIAPNTLRTHVQNIMAKLRVHSKLEAVAFALRHRLVEPPRYEDALY